MMAHMLSQTPLDHVHRAPTPSSSVPPVDSSVLSTDAMSEDQMVSHASSGQKISRDSASLHSQSTSSDNQKAKKSRSIDTDMEHLSIASASSVISDLGDLYSAPTSLPPPHIPPTSYPELPPWTPPPEEDTMSSSSPSPPSPGLPDLDAQYKDSSVPDGAIEE
jgi:hypothetical protein